MMTRVGAFNGMSSMISKHESSLFVSVIVPPIGKLLFETSFDNLPLMIGEVTYYNILLKLNFKKIKNWKDSLSDTKPEIYHNIIISWGGRNRLLL